MLMAKVLYRRAGRICLQSIAEVFPSTLTPIEDQKLLATWKAITNNNQERSESRRSLNSLGKCSFISTSKDYARDLPNLEGKIR